MQNNQIAVLVVSFLFLGQATLAQDDTVSTKSDLLKSKITGEARLTTGNGLFPDSMEIRPVLEVENSNGFGGSLVVPYQMARFQSSLFAIGRPAVEIHKSLTADNTLRLTFGTKLPFYDKAQMLDDIYGNGGINSPDRYRSWQFAVGADDSMRIASSQWQLLLASRFSYDTPTSEWVDYTDNETRSSDYEYRFQRPLVTRNSVGLSYSGDNSETGFKYLLIRSIGEGHSQKIGATFSPYYTTPPPTEFSDPVSIHCFSLFTRQPLAAKTSITGQINWNISGSDSSSHNGLNIGNNLASFDELTESTGLILGVGLSRLF